MKERLLRLLDKLKLQLGFKTRYLKMLDRKVIMIPIKANDKIPKGREKDSIIAMHECQKAVERTFAIGSTNKFGGVIVIPIRAIDYGPCLDLMAKYKFGY